MNLFDSPPAGHEGPYLEGPARVVMARDANYWLPDIEAYLVEQDLDIDLAPAVVALMNRFGGTVADHVAAIRRVLDAHAEAGDG